VDLEDLAAADWAVVDLAVVGKKSRAATRCGSTFFTNEPQRVASLLLTR
jgi:hypothetical protein